MIRIHIHEHRDALGKAAAQQTAGHIHRLLAAKDSIRMIFAAAPSQQELYYHLIQDTSIPWNRITAFHMDEYIGLDSGAEQGFGNFLHRHLFQKLPFRDVHYIPVDIPPEESCRRYATKLGQDPIDICCLGIGENGHIAFNDPAYADFFEEKRVKLVELDEICRRQQVNDGCFSLLSEVPRTAITLSIPMLLSSRYLICSVPGKSKAQAIHKTVEEQISSSCPASIMQAHEKVDLFLDRDSASLLRQQ